MAAEVESMFNVRKAPWHGLGTKVADAPTSEDALRVAGLNWDIKACPVRQRDIQQQKVILTCPEELICFHYGTGIIYQETIFLKCVFQAFNQA